VSPKITPPGAYGNLDRQLVAGIGWTALLRWTAQLVSWVATFFAARMLGPGDYGIMSMATVAVGLVRTVEDFGLDSILVQDRSIQGVRQARLAGLVLMVGVAFCLAFLALAHPVAAFFKEPQVAAAVAALSLLFVTDALQLVPRATLQRALAFRRFASLALVQALATQGVLVTGAVLHWGSWALVSSTLAGAFAVTSVLVFWQPYRVAWPRDLRGLGRPLLQGWRVIVGRLAGYGFGSVDQTLVGRVLGKDALGAYSFATTFANLPFQEVGAIVSKVVPGIFSGIQQQRDELRRYFLILTEFVSYLTLPMSIGLALTADLAVRAALGPEWLAVVDPLRLLCLYAAFQGCQILVAHVLTWTGQFRALMWCTILAGATMPVGFYFAAPHGLPAVALVWAVLYPIVNIPPLVICFRTIDIRLGDWLGALRPAAVACLAMGAAVLAVRAGLGTGGSIWVRLAVTCGAGAAVYAAVLWFGFRARVLAIVGLVRFRESGPRARPAAEVP